jgi:hypothetical protein
MITALFWANAQPVVAIPYRNSGRHIGAILKGQEPLARNYRYSLRNSPEERGSQRERTSGSSELPLSLKYPHQNTVCIFQITSFTQISSTKHCVHLPSYLFHSNLLNKTLYASSKVPLSLKSPQQNTVCNFQINSFPEISPPKPCMHMSSSPYVPHYPPISFFWTLSIK